MIPRRSARGSDGAQQPFGNLFPGRLLRRVHRRAAHSDRALVAVQVRSARRADLQVAIELSAPICRKLSFEVLEQELDDFPACDFRG